MTPQARTQWIIAAFFVALLVVVVVFGSRCARQDGDASSTRSLEALAIG